MRLSKCQQDCCGSHLYIYDIEDLNFYTCITIIELLKTFNSFLSLCRYVSNKIFFNFITWTTSCLHEKDLRIKLICRYYKKI